MKQFIQHVTSFKDLPRYKRDLEIFGTEEQLAYKLWQDREQNHCNGHVVMADGDEGHWHVWRADEPQKLNAGDREPMGSTLQAFRTTLNQARRMLDMVMHP